MKKLIILVVLGMFTGLGYTADTVIVGHLGGGPIEYETIPNWDPAVASVHMTTGVDEGMVVTINGGDSTKIDITAGSYHIQGPKYSFAAITALDPGFGAGENSMFIGMTMNGYTSQVAPWTVAQKQVLIPIARLNTPSGQTGPGSDVGLIRDDKYYVTERDYKDRLWNEEAIGSLYVTGGQLYSYSTIVLGQYSGILYNAQRERHVLDAYTNMSAIFVSHTTGGVPVATKARLVVSNALYDTGTGLAAMQANKWKKDSVVKSPQGTNSVAEGGWFYIYGTVEYGTKEEAEAADFDYGIFISQAVSGLVPLADIVVKKDGVTLDTDLFITDRRSCLVCRP